MPRAHRAAEARQSTPQAQAPGGRRRRVAFADGAGNGRNGRTKQETLTQMPDVLVRCGTPSLRRDNNNNNNNNNNNTDTGRRTRRSASSNIRHRRQNTLTQMHFVQLGADPNEGGDGLEYEALEGIDDYNPAAHCDSGIQGKAQDAEEEEESTSNRSRTSERTDPRPMKKRRTTTREIVKDDCVSIQAAEERLRSPVRKSMGAAHKSGSRKRARLHEHERAQEDADQEKRASTERESNAWHPQRSSSPAGCSRIIPSSQSPEPSPTAARSEAVSTRTPRSPLQPRLLNNSSSRVEPGTRKGHESSAHKTVRPSTRSHQIGQKHAADDSVSGDSRNASGPRRSPASQPSPTPHRLHPSICIPDSDSETDEPAPPCATPDTPLPSRTSLAQSSAEIAADPCTIPRMQRPKPTFSQATTIGTTQATCPSPPGPPPPPPPLPKPADTAAGPAPCARPRSPPSSLRHAMELGSFSSSPILERHSMKGGAADWTDSQLLPASILDFTLPGLPGSWSQASEQWAE